MIKSISYESLNFNSIYNNDIFEKPKFSKDGSKLIMMIEEENKTGLQNYFDIPEDEYFNSSFNKNLKRFEYKESFGEMQSDKSDPIIIILDLIKFQSFVVNTKKYLGENFYPFQPFFDNENNIFFGAFEFPFKKLGITFCLNRKCSIYQIKSIESCNQDTLLINHTKEYYTSLYPKLSPNRQNLIFFTSEESYPHINGF